MPTVTMAPSRRMLAALGAVLCGDGASAAHAAAAQPGLYGLNGGDTLGLFYQQLNGSATWIGDPQAIATGEQHAAIDAARGIFYTLGMNTTTNACSLLGQSLVDGSVVVDVACALTVGGLVGVGQALAVEPASGKLVAVGTTAAGALAVGFLDPADGSFSPAAALDASLTPLLGGVGAYDPLTNTFLSNWYNSTDSTVDFYSANLATGAVTQWQDDAATGKSIWTLDYDAGSGTFVGLGAKGRQVTLERLDARNFSYSTIAPLPPGYDGGLGGMVALDAAAAVVYYLVMKPGTNHSDPNNPFFLTALSLRDASVVSTSALPICTLNTNCPWSLEMYAPGQGVLSSS